MFSVLKALPCSLLSLAFSLIFLSEEARSANVYTLFSIQRPVESYDETTDLLRKGDIVFFGFKKAVLGELLGQGGSKYVFENALQPEEVLHIPSKVMHFKAMRASIEGEASLLHNRVPHVKIKRHWNHKIAVAERLPQQAVLLIDAIDFALKHPEKRDVIERAIEKFARATAMYVKIGNFHSGQVALIPDTEELLLVDWHAHHVYAQAVSDSHIFAGFYPQISYEQLSPDDKLWIHKLEGIAKKATLDRRSLFKAEEWTQFVPEIQIETNKNIWKKCVGYLTRQFKK